MKRLASSYDGGSASHQIKKTKLDATFNIEALCNDCLVNILSYLEFKDLFSCLLVCKDWSVLLRSEHAIQHFFICFNLQQFFLDKFEQRDEWFVKLRTWITGLYHCFELSSYCDVFKNRELMKRQQFQPFIDIISFEYASDICMSFEVTVHLEQEVSLRLKFCLSYTEDEYVYTNVESGNSKFDWKKFNIDPSKKSIIVFRFNGSEEEDTDCTVEEYEKNSEFFMAFSEYFQFEDLFEFLKRHLNFQPRRTYNTMFDFAEDEEVNCCDFTSNEDLDIRHEILEMPIIRVAESYRLECLDVMINVIERTYSYMVSKMETTEIKENEIVISNVVGISHVVRFNRNYLRNIHTDFTLKFNDKSWTSDFQVKEHFYYGHDGYEGNHLFKLTDCETGEETFIGGYTYGVRELVVWESDSIEQLKSIGLPFDNVLEFISRVIDKLLPQLPCYDPFNGKPTSNQSLYLYLKGTDEEND